MPSQFENEYVGIRGWLGLFAIGVLATPFILLLDIRDSLNARNYGKVFHNNWFIPAITFFDVVFLLLYCLSIFWMFKRKAGFRRLSTHLLWTKALVTTFFFNTLLIDTNKAVTSGLITKAAVNEMTDVAGSNSGRVILFAVIWIPYLRRSKRVRSTFNG